MSPNYFTVFLPDLLTDTALPASASPAPSISVALLLPLHFELVFTLAAGGAAALTAMGAGMVGMTAGGVGAGGGSAGGLRAAGGLSMGMALTGLEMGGEEREQEGEWEEWEERHGQRWHLRSRDC